MSGAFPRVTSFPLLAFNEGVHDFRRVRPPDWVAEDYGVVAGNVNLVCDCGAALRFVVCSPLSEMRFVLFRLR